MKDKNKTEGCQIKIVCSHLLENDSMIKQRNIITKVEQEFNCCLFPFLLMCFEIFQLCCK